MKKIKFSSDFILSVGLLYVCAVIMHGAVLPYLKKDSGPASTIGVKNYAPYNISPSSVKDGFFNFNYDFEKTLSGQKQVSFDMPIKSFNKESVQKYLSLNFPGVSLDNITDAWGYPRRENAFLKKSLMKRGGGGDAKSDEDPDILGLVNCRENTDVTGYFKAYFEDVALNNNIGYDDPTYGNARREEACQVLQDISEVIKLDETSVTPDVIFSNSNQVFPAGALASASAYYGYYDSYPDNGSLHKHIISRVDPTPGQGDFDAIVNTNFNGFNFDVDTELNEITYDLYTVLYHEVMHALGFASIIPSVIPETGIPFKHNTFSYFSYRNENVQESFISHESNNLQIPVGSPPSWFTTDQVSYMGEKNIVGYSPDGIRPVFSPGFWQQGSSLSHFDMNRADGEVYVMNSYIGTNTEREIHLHELEVLCHLGYQVEGIDGCEDPTPFANNNIFVIEEDLSMCLNVLDNDYSFSNGNLFINSFENVFSSNGDTFSFYSGEDCSGSGSSDPFGAKSIRFSYLSGEESSRIFNYSAYDFVSNRISNKASVLITLCNSENGEYVCNGDFELPMIVPGSGSMAFDCDSWNPGETVPFWCKFIGNGDLMNIQTTNPLYYIPLDCSSSYLFVFNDCLLNTPDQSNQMGFILQQKTPNKNEGITTGLVSPLTPGGTYKLSYDVKVLIPSQNSFVLASNPDLVQEAKLYSGLYTGPHIYQGYDITDIEPFDQQIAVAYLPFNVGNQEWIHMEHTFTAEENHDFLAIYGDIVASGEQNAMFYIDNVSIKPIDDSIGFKISGKVYNDLNQSGNLEQGESLLPGINVGLFIEGQDNPIQTVTTQEVPNDGEYEFIGLENGDYYLALVNEQNISMITEPLLNTLLNNFNYARSVVISGANINNQNFGVYLSGEDGYVQSDIKVKKSLIDSSISFFDRNITWSIEISNEGSQTVTNLLVSDVIPTGLFYYTHIINSPNSYNPNSGIITVPEILPGETVVMNLVNRVPLKACGQKINTVNVLSFSGLDTNFSNNSSYAVFKLKPCKIDGTLNSGALPG